MLDSDQDNPIAAMIQQGQHSSVDSAVLGSQFEQRSSYHQDEAGYETSGTLHYDFGSEGFEYSARVQDSAAQAEAHRSQEMDPAVAEWVHAVSRQIDDFRTQYIQGPSSHVPQPSSTRRRNGLSGVLRGFLGVG